MTKLYLISIGLLCLLALTNASTAKKVAAHQSSSASNDTATSKEAATAVSTRKERLNVLNGFSNGLLGMLGNGGGGSSSTGAAAGGSGSGGLGGIQQGLKGIQAIQKLVTRFQDVVKMPFSFRGLTDSMATMTGLLAAVGGGYLTYVTMVALFGSMLDPQNTAYQHAYSAPPHQYAPGQYAYSNLQVAGQPAQVQGYNRRQSSDHGGFHIGSVDLSKMYHTIANFNYPEASFKLLRIKDEACKQRAVCELEKFLAKKGVASVILKGVSKKITGMDKYLEAAYRGISNEECSYIYSSCPTTLGQTLLRSVGLN